jgi:uncharacterized membrane protein
VCCLILCKFRTLLCQLRMHCLQFSLYRSISVSCLDIFVFSLIISVFSFVISSLMVEPFIKFY